MILLCYLLLGVLSPHMSYPLIQMVSSNTKHCLSNPRPPPDAQMQAPLPIYHQHWRLPVNAAGPMTSMEPPLLLQLHQQESSPQLHQQIWPQTNPTGHPSNSRLLPPSSSVSRHQTGTSHPSQPSPLPIDIEWKPNHGLNNSDLPFSPFILLNLFHPLVLMTFLHSQCCIMSPERREEKFKAMGNDAVTPSTYQSICSPPMPQPCQ